MPGNAGELAGLAARGVVGFKAFMSATGVDEFRACDDDDLHAGMAAAAELGLPVAVHAEDDELTARLAARAAAEGRVGMRDYLASRPVEAEVRAVERALALAAATGCALHVVHISSGRAVGLVAEARARGVDVTCEVCPHHLLLTDEDAERIGVLAKCAPPLRPAAETERLWAGLAAGDIAWVASDHSPAPPELKTGDALHAWGGIAGAQSTLELLLTARRLPLGRLAWLLGGAAARRLRLAGKGSLEVGADADLALVDLGAARTLDAAELLYRHKVSPYAGRRLAARVERTILRGETVYAAGAVVGPARGRLVAPALEPGLGSGRGPAPARRPRRGARRARGAARRAGPARRHRRHGRAQPGSRAAARAARPRARPRARGLEADGGRVRLGAALTHGEVVAELRERLPAVATAARATGSDADPQPRHRGRQRRHGVAQRRRPVRAASRPAPRSSSAPCAAAAACRWPTS